MNIPELLKIPDNCLVSSRLTKKQLIEKGDLGKRDRKLISENIDKIEWTAAYKPENSGIRSFIKEIEIYDEIEIISILMKKKGKEKSIAQIIQKIIPYHLLIIMVFENEVSFQLAEKQVNQNDSEKRTINIEYYCDWVNIESEIFQKFIDEWKNIYYQVGNIKLLYKNMINLIENLSIARETGKFEIKGADEIKKDKNVLKEIEELEIEIEKLRKMLKHETRFSERLALNKKIKFINNYITNIKFPRK